jgi:hypothetical protein
LWCVAVAAILIGCSAGAVQTLAPGQTPAATPPGQSAAPANAQLFGTVNFDSHSSFSNPPGDPNGNGTDGFKATVNVALKLDATSGEYADVGSTFTLRWETHRDKEIGIDPSCTGIMDGSSDVKDKKFSDPPAAPDDPGSDIHAIYDTTLNSFTLWVDMSYLISQTFNACMSGQAVTNNFYSASGPLSCGGFGLGGVVTVNPSGPDQIDLACTLNEPSKNGSTTVAGVLTLNN